MAGLQHKFFVLEPAGTSLTAQASRMAMVAYARVIEANDPRLAKELRDWATREWQKSDKNKITSPPEGPTQLSLPDDDIPIT